MLILIASLFAGTAAAADDSAAVKALFAHPPRQYSTGPLWVWNDMLTEEEVRSSLRDLAAQQVKQAWVHPRPGLMTPYLSADWFRLWKAALAEAQRLDMNLWIYDENSYPPASPAAGSPNSCPSRAAAASGCTTRKGRRSLARKSSAVYRRAGQGYENVTPQFRAGGPAQGRFPRCQPSFARRNSPWYGNRSYVDLMHPGVTEKFLDVTLNAYQRAIGGGVRPPRAGIVLRRAEHQPLRHCPGPTACPQAFQKRWGYSLLDNLPSLIRPVGDWRRVRHDYFQTLNDEFIEHWSKPYHDYCEQHKPGVDGPLLGPRSGPSAAACPTTWRCTPGTSGRRSTA